MQSKKYRLLIIEDDRTLAEGLQRALTMDDRQVHLCENLRKAKEYLQKETVDLILLDVNLPDGNGVDFLENVRKTSDVPVILLTANDLEMDIVNGLEQGANDYITKPFSLAVLRARVHAQLRSYAGARNHANEAAGQIWTSDRYRFDFTQMLYQVDGEVVELSKTEQKLLSILVQNAGQTVPREMLLERIWTDGAEYVDENALSVAVKRLRDKLHAKEQIRTVYGIGYVWEKV